MKRAIYEAISSKFDSIQYCLGKGITEWASNHKESIDSICKEHLPCGSGFDCGTTFNFDESKPERLVFNTAFHHMNENGYYDGWSEHKVIVTPSLIGRFHLRVTGRNRNSIKDYIADTFRHAIDQEIGD